MRRTVDRLTFNASAASSSVISPRSVRSRCPASAVQSGGRTRARANVAYLRGGAGRCRFPSRRTVELAKVARQQHAPALLPHRPLLAACPRPAPRAQSPRCDAGQNLGRAPGLDGCLDLLPDVRPANVRSAALRIATLPIAGSGFATVASYRSFAFSPSSTRRRMASDRLGLSVCFAAQASTLFRSSGDRRMAVTGS